MASCCALSTKQTLMLIALPVKWTKQNKNKAQGTRPERPLPRLFSLSFTSRILSFPYFFKVDYIKGQMLNDFEMKKKGKCSKTPHHHPHM